MAILLIKQIKVQTKFIGNAKVRIVKEEVTRQVKWYHLSL